MRLRAQRDRRAVDGEAELAQQVLEGAHVIFMPVSGNHGNDAIGVLAQVREVGQDEVDAVHVGVGEHQPAVDEQQATVVAGALLDGHAVAADLAETTEEHDAYGRCHQRHSLRGEAVRTQDVGGTHRATFAGSTTLPALGSPRTRVLGPSEGAPGRL